ncbi:centrosomal protein of 192 kDa isoform X2 [Amia ocellicauda]|uniref:centrosomal protein of 192 kDa isoform X2 n=1 Tax=Amia ocellicauda TaxID=2972642 RepID=UPI003463BE7E
MTESFGNIEDEPFPSFLSNSLGSSSAALGNVTLGSTLGLPVAASTVAKIRSGADNRVPDTQASYLEDGQLSLANSQSLNGENGKFALSFKDDLEDADQFIAAHRISDLLVKVQLDDTGPSCKRDPFSRGSLQRPSAHFAGRPSGYGDDLSTGLITLSHLGTKVAAPKHTSLLPETIEEENAASEGVDSDNFSASISSFLANEKLVSLDSMNSDSTDDDFDVDELHDDELELYFKKMVPPAMQRGRVEGQELPAAEHNRNQENAAVPSSADQENDRFQFLDDCDLDDFQMPHIRLAATGMDSCPASDEEDTEDELEAARRHSDPRPRFLLPSTTRQLVGESNRPSFRPGLEGGSSDEETPARARNVATHSGIEFRRSAEGQVINSPVTGDGGGGGDGSSGSDEEGNDGGVSTIPLFSSNTQANYDGLRGLGIVGGNVAEDDAEEPHSVQGASRECVPGHSEMEDRVGPVGTGEAGSDGSGVLLPRASTFQRSLTLGRQEALDAMDNTASASPTEGHLDSLYLRNFSRQWKPPDHSTSSFLQGTQSSFHLSQVVPSHCPDKEAETLGLRGGPCGYSMAPEPQTDSNSEEELHTAAKSHPSLEAKYLSQTFPAEDSDDGWHNCPENLGLKLNAGGNAMQDVVYQNEEGKWVTDLAYYNSFEKELETNLPENVPEHLETEDFVSGSDAMNMIEEDQEEFEKEHRFIQEEEMVAQNTSLGIGDTSWRLPSSNYILMRASQAPTEFEKGSQSYLRLSLGQFFEQRSEALGCLGDDAEDNVKRPSFGYVIASPEKREPFALIRPSDFSSWGSLDHDEAVNVSDADETMNPEDLDKTLEAKGEGKAPEADHTEAAPKENKHTQPNVPSNQHVNDGNTDSPSNNSDFMLSISTIASAIADASVSSDPAQLAAMIMELSKKNRCKKSSASVQKPIPLDPDQTSLLEALQKSTSAGELSLLDIEKYLKKTEAAASDSEAETYSMSPYSFDSVDWADRSGAPQRHSDPSPPADHRTSVRQEERVSRKDSPAEPGSSAEVTKMSPDAPQNTHPNKDNLRRSALPRPKAGSNPVKHPGSTEQSFVAAKPVTELKPSLNRSGFQGALNSTTAWNRNEMEPFSEQREAGAKFGPVRPNVSSVETAPRPTISSSTLKPTEAHSSLSKSPQSQQSAPSGLPSNRNLPANPEVQNTTGKGYEKAPILQKSPARKVSRSPSKGPEKRVSFVGPNSLPSAQRQNGIDPLGAGSPERTSKYPEESQFTFRPSTSPLTHSSPSQVSSQTTNGSSPSCDGVVEQQACGQPSPQSSCDSPSLSRLTYISVCDSTLHNSTAIPSPETSNSKSSFSLSTTIVRSSPTPPGDQDGPSNSQHAAPLHKRSPGSPAQKARSSDDDRCNAQQDRAARCRSECNGHPASKALPSNGGSHKRHSEPVPSHLTQGESGYSTAISAHQSASAEQSSQQWRNMHTRDMASLNAFSATGLGLQPSLTSEDMRYIPISSFKPQGAVLDLPPSVPTLLTGRSLFSSQIAQQYLGGNVPMYPYHMGPASGMYSVPTGLPCTNPTMTHAGSLGVPTSGHLPAGFMSQGQHYRAPPSSLDPGLLSVSKPYCQHDEMEGLGMWGSGGLSSVRVPEELKFPNACCVGIASQTSLSIFNPTDRWLQVGIAVSSLSIDGEKVESLPYQWLIVKNKTIIGPKTTEEQKVLFIPLQAGVYQCVLSVSSWPVSSQTETVAQAEAFAQKVVLMAMAANPSLEVDIGPSGCLNFGDLTVGSIKALPLKLINNSHATVPVRLVISANAMAWRCFTFSKSPVAVPAEGVMQACTVSPLAAPSVMNHVMHANYGDNPETFLVWVHFRAPQKYISSSGELGPADEYTARVDIEVDSPGPSHVIKSIPLHARAGIARVHAPKDLQTVHLTAPFGKITKQTLPLKNAGNIDVQLKLKSTDAEDCFSVKPEDLHLQAGDEHGVVVSFTAQGSKKYRESVLTILVLPTGPQYEVVLKGEMTVEEVGRSVSSGKPLSSDSVTASEVPPILSNKQFMAWGGVTLGRAVQQKLVLRNNSPSSVQQLRLLIRGQDQDCFQLQSTFGPEERLSSHRELTIRPKEDVSVHLLFAPTRVACMIAKLEIKQSGIRSSQPGIKFTIPLSGYGGTSNIILEDVKKLSDRYVVTLNGVASGRVGKVCFAMRNTGSRAAFIKALPFADLQTRTLMDSAIISVSPSQFVLKERTQEVITLLCKPTRREQVLSQSSSSVLSTVCFFCGDEISRQQFRRLLGNKPGIGKQVLSENSLLKNINFNEKFFGEEQVTEVYDLPQRPNDAQLFYGNMNKVILSVLGSSEPLVTGENDYMESLQPSPRHSSESDSGFGNSDRHVSNVSLDVLPVKGPQGPTLPLNVPDPVLNPASEPQKSWSVQPEQIVLAAPTISGVANTGHVKIMNQSSKALNFELSWPAHCLTITPQHGLIEPESHLQILISPNPSLASKSSILPWSGQIYIQCDNQQKFIRVQIREDLTLDVSATACTAKQLGVLPAQPETPVLQMAKPLPKPGSSKVEIKNRTLVFPATGSGEISEAYLEVENSGEEEVRWYLSSFAPPYVKGVDSSGDVYRATYTAFRCSRVSGTIGMEEKIKVPITFLPRDRGDYAQFWDLECHPVAEPHMKYRIRFQLCGTGIKAGGAQELNKDDSLVRTEATVKARKRSGSDASAVKASQEEGTPRGVYAPQDLYTFPSTRVGESSTLKVNVRNNSFATHMISTLHQPARPVQTSGSREVRHPAAHTDRRLRKSRYSAYW